MNTGNDMGAGFVLYKENPFRIFCLITDKKGKLQLDLPKGKADEGDESLLQTAIRECYEECGIVPLVENIEDSMVVNNGALTLYVCPYGDNQVPNIQPNPESGKIEHMGWCWATRKQFRKHCLYYLREVLDYLDSE